MLSFLMLIIHTILQVPLGKTYHSPYVPIAIYTKLYGNFYHNVLYYFLICLSPLLKRSSQLRDNVLSLNFQCPTVLLTHKEWINVSGEKERMQESMNNKWKERNVEIDKREKWALELRNKFTTSYTVSSEALKQQNSPL